MPLFNSQHHSGRGMRWLGTAATAVVELLVVVVVGVAVVRYLEWSSDAAQAEFMRATKSSVSAPNPSGEFSTPVQALKGRAGCDRKG